MSLSAGLEKLMMPMCFQSHPCVNKDRVEHLEGQDGRKPLKL